jgi:acyl phosphate:glycerol-3-phosphate acyltransferase
MAPQSTLLVLIPLAYLVGSIPFGLIVGLAKGVDPRTAGSGNIGATNVARLLGKKWFFVVFFLDMLKGMLPVLLASTVAHRIPEMDRTAQTYLLWLLVAFAAVLGHMFSVFLKFKGGKGVATSAGVMLGLFPYYTLPGIVAVVVFLVVFFVWRYVSLGSIAGACAFPVAYFVIAQLRGWPIFASQLPLLIFGVVIALLIVYKHRTNIARLRAGTENRISSSMPKPAA